MMTKQGIALRMDFAVVALRDPAGLNFANFDLRFGVESTYYM
jgi:hypothetical protein